jgi:hypothetical protein
LLCIFDFFNILSRIVIMAVMYCSDCGAKLHYEVSKPKFCSECGATISGKEKASEEDAAEVNGESFGKIKGLQYEISAPQEGKTSLGSIIGTNEGAEVERRDAPPKNGGDPLADAIKACASSKEKGKINK